MMIDAAIEPFLLDGFSRRREPSYSDAEAILYAELGSSTVRIEVHSQGLSYVVKVHVVATNLELRKYSHPITVEWIPIEKVHTSLPALIALFEELNHSIDTSNQLQESHHD